jgi:hypothetical protein
LKTIGLSSFQYVTDVEEQGFGAFWAGLGRIVLQMFYRNPGVRMETKRLILSGGELQDWPGHWKITGRFEDESDTWSIVRKPDGSFWEVAGVHYFPPTGGTLRIDLCDQILDAKRLTQCEEYYDQLQKKLAEQRGVTMNPQLKLVGDEWAAFDPSVPNQPLVTGKTKEECLRNLQQWEKDRGRTPGDSQRRIWSPN